jgi:hypothetical protein
MHDLVEEQLTAPSTTRAETFFGADHVRDRSVLGVVVVDWRTVVDVRDAGDVVVCPACLLLVPEQADARSAVATKIAPSATVSFRCVRLKLTFRTYCTPAPNLSHLRPGPPPPVSRTTVRPALQDI